MDANSFTLMSSDRKRRPIDARTSGSSSMTNTVAVASDIALLLELGISLCLGLVLWRSGAFLVPIPEREQSQSPLQGERGVHQSLRSAGTALMALSHASSGSMRIVDMVGSSRRAQRR